MLAIKKARKLIEADPAQPAAQTISQMVLALESGAEFSVTRLYTLDNTYFDLALEILDEWRLDRHYANKLRLIDTSTHIQELTSGGYEP